MKSFRYTIIITLFVGILFSCKTKPVFTTVSHPVKVNGKFDQILTSFPNLYAKNTFTDSSRLWMQNNYYFYQVYQKKHESNPFTGTINIKNWNDTLKAEGLFKNGHIQRYTEWYSNGQKSREFIRSSEKKHPPVLTIKTWYYKGQLMSVTNEAGLGKRFYKDGSLKALISSTQTIDYWKNGKQQAVWPLDRGRKGFNLDGEWKGWHKNGHLGIKGQYTNGRKNGPWYYYDSTGYEEKIEFYHKGKLDSTNHVTHRS
jgi:antitoxin component YwqK of YwqJK toxin-antitoxin module